MHVHTSVSDGMFTPHEVVYQAREIRLSGLAITDHDTVDGIAEALDEAKSTGDIQVIPGIEINTDAGRSEVHILGYYIDHDDDRLRQSLLKIRQARRERAAKMIRKLNAMGFEVTLDRVAEMAEGGLIGRPHLARALMEKGYVFSIKEAFEKLLGRGKPGYVPRYKLTPDEAICIIKRAGGIPVLAHPGLVGDDALVSRIIELGIEGLEINYPEHGEEERRKYAELARQKGLLVTAGSDYHGMPHEGRGKLGCEQAEDWMVDELRKKGRKTGKK